MRTAPNGATSYEAWARRGMVRWVREYAPDGGYDYRVVETIGARRSALTADQSIVPAIDDSLIALFENFNQLIALVGNGDGLQQHQATQRQSND